MIDFYVIMVLILTSNLKMEVCTTAFKPSRCKKVINMTYILSNYYFDPRCHVISICSCAGENFMTFEYLIEHEVKLCVRLFHLVALIQAEEGATQKMLRVVHDDLKEKMC